MRILMNMYEYVNELIKRAYSLLFDEYWIISIQRFRKSLLFTTADMKSIVNYLRILLVFCTNMYKYK